ncbi:chloride channel protein ClC-Ka isoform X2 [Catharus ustulatus]|uniref:chloride channel protein ClC-Ka isoform X2 n=1 Tax=Catharus ustulatus TaxID=91951 RepID=UPI00140960C9|nr:chloride channel protein ClC-Ka isoform X2 [Catharus ustulatus]
MERPVPGGLRGEKEEEEEERVLVSEHSWRPCPTARRRVQGCLEWVKRQLFRVGEDWYFLFILGVLMATISFTMDIIIARLHAGKTWRGFHRRLGAPRGFGGYLSGGAAPLPTPLLQPTCGCTERSETSGCSSTSRGPCTPWHWLPSPPASPRASPRTPEVSQLHPDLPGSLKCPLGDGEPLKFEFWFPHPRLALGSGISELKTILMGVVLEDYLAIKNFGAKVVGLTCTLTCGSTLFLGKVGPYVHLSAMAAAYLGKMRTTVTREYENKFKQHEMLVAAQAVGVATVFGAPISGVLFSIEVMSPYFAVRDYWRGFFAATCGAFMFRLLAVFNSEQGKAGQAGCVPSSPLPSSRGIFGVLTTKPTPSFLFPLPETIAAVFKSNLKIDFPFDLLETFFFLILGIICGIVACAYLFCQRWLMVAVRKNQLTAKLLATDKPVYTVLVVLLFASITFPPGLGQFMASRLTMKEYLTSLFENRTWGLLTLNASGVAKPGELWQEWDHPSATIYGTLIFFLLMKFWMLILATTLPLPAGYFMPIFIYGESGAGRTGGTVRPGEGGKGFIEPLEWGYWKCIQPWRGIHRVWGYRGGIQFQEGCRKVVTSTSTIFWGTSWDLPTFPPPPNLGAAIGRLVGEVVALLFPRGLYSEGPPRPIIPAGYALAGAAAFSGSVTHAVSTSLLVCEATGHMGHVLPTVLAVLVANAITQKNQPSFYDAPIIVKKLPYLPPIRSRHIASYRVVVEEFMERQVVALAKGDGFQEVLAALDASTDAEYPVVESIGSPTLVGTVSRSQLVTFLQSHEHPQALQGEKLAIMGTLGDDCTIEPIMLQFSPWTSLHQAYHLFQLLKLQRVFVTRSGELVGAVSRAELRRAIEDVANPK